MRRHLWRLAMLAMAAAFLPLVAAAQYPDRPVSIVVPYAAGGATDIVARLLAESMERQMGQRFLTVNRPGANGVTGTRGVAAAAPDGYTLLFVPSAYATQFPLSKSLPYAESSFSAVSVAASNAYVLSVHPRVPARSVADLIAYARANPRLVEYGSGGVGTAPHLAGALLNSMAGLDILHVPYSGAGANRADLLSGRVAMIFENAAAILPLVQRGEVNALAVTTAERIPLLPDVPTMRESGYPEFVVDGWLAMLAPAGTPEAVVTKLNRGVETALTEPAMRERLRLLGAAPIGGDAASAARFLAAEGARWTAVIRGAGIEPQ
jgi:tripartite-type tricarboxylate transporter receptor subunit TctC